MGEKKRRFFPIILILTAFSLLAGALYGQDYWLRYEKREAVLPVLEQGAFLEGTDNREPDCLILWDSADETSQNAAESIPYILKEMKVPFSKVDIRTEEIPDCRDYETAVLAFGNYSAAGDLLIELMDWVDTGGRLMIACPPEADAFFRSFSQKMGIQSYDSQFYRVSGIRIKDSFLLHGDVDDYMIQDPFKSAFLVEITEDSRLYLASADKKEMPLLWARNCGEGKIVFDNLGIYEKSFRGFHCAAYSLLEDMCVYPVINGAAFYIDDFPAPSLTGSDFYVKRDYGINTADFYANVWWPGMLDIAKKHGTIYTGMMLVSYENATEPPFKGTEGAGKFRYYGNSVLEQGGEIGLHGFNHQPLAEKGFEPGLDYEKDMEYRYWADAGDMAAGLTEANRFFQSIFPKETIKVYAPPSNILSEEGRRTLSLALPDLIAVAGSYFEGSFVSPQEFRVAEDGIVDIPRITFGARISDYERLLAVSELNMHYVNSHSLHPQDVLDPHQGAGLGWETLKAEMDAYLEWIDDSSMGIRKMTGSEMAAAVQRFYYVNCEKTETDGMLILDLENFRDEAWFLIRMNDWIPQDPGACITGGTLELLQDRLYLLKAEQPHIEIYREVK